MAGLALRCIFWEKFPRVNAGLSTPHVFKIILRIDGERMINDVICEKKKRTKKMLLEL